MIRVVSWNIAKRWEPWRELVEMARRGEVDVALLQEAGSPPGDLVNTIEFEDDVLWSRHLYDRWPLVVRLSDRVEVEGFRQVPPVSELGHAATGDPHACRTEGRRFARRQRRLMQDLLRRIDDLVAREGLPWKRDGNRVTISFTRDGRSQVVHLALSVNRL